MSTVITVLTLTLFAAAAVSGALAVFMATMTIFSRPKRKIVKIVRSAETALDDGVQVFFREPESKLKIRPEVKTVIASAPVSKVKTAKKPVAAKKSLAAVKAGKIENLLAGLPGGYHVLTAVDISLEMAVKFKNSELKSGKIDYLIIAPRRIYVLKATAGVRPNYKRLTEKVEADAKLIELFLSQKLSKEFRVCAWVIINSEPPAGKYPATIVNKEILKEALVKFERTSQGKTKLPARESLPEIISVLKLAKWEQPEPRKMAVV